MMYAFAILFFSFLVSLVNASPLLSLRDVFSPHITSPNENTVWPIGTKQIVIWETADIPPDSQLTSTNGRVVLGHLGPTGGLNLQLDNPLAENFYIRLGKIEITVPSVPPRNDYIIVLFGDSGNASPAFAITRITNGELSSNSSSSASLTSSSASVIPTSASVTPKSASVTRSSSSESLITTPIPITGSVITGGESSVTSPTTTETLPSSILPDPLTTQSVPVPQTTVSESTSDIGSPAPTSNSAWASYRFNSIYTLSVGIASLFLMLVV